MTDRLYLALNLRKRLILFLCIVLACFFILTLGGTVLMWVMGSDTRSLRILAVLQDVLLFILPAVLTALLVCRKPATLLAIDKAPDLKSTIIALLVLSASVPAMNFIIYLNENIPLPLDWETALRASENEAAAAVDGLIGPHTIPNLILSILIVGILAGVSEEILFRGGLQRLLVTGGINPHAAIWITALLFSLLHMQFFGLVPRMLLGAFFGYALYWSGSLWLPILLHAVNNTLYIISEYTAYGETDATINTIGSGHDYLLVAISALATSGLVFLLYRYGRKTSVKCEV